MNNLSPAAYLMIFVLGCAFQAGGFVFITRASNKRLTQFEEKLNSAMLDIAWIKGRMSRNGGRKR